ncbi:MAG: NUDIX domain-containing protein [Clostridiales bacterium]|jgi:ADP-ribose pyrophosphatase YjhB (NUDIX family)|nr:NUDIX domain-containing protein [Clostridiales bacterium]
MKNLNDKYDKNFDNLDLTFNTKQGRFNYRVGAIIVKDDSILMAKNENVAYYYSVGGRVKMFESSEQAVLREAKEETGLDFEVDRLGFIYENLFYDKAKDWKFHGLCLFYFLKPAKDWSNLSMRFVEKDMTQKLCNHYLQWIPLNSIHKFNIVPKFFKTELKKHDSGVRHIVDKK